MKKSLLVLFASICLVGIVMICVGCNEAEAPHSHAYSEEWQYDETNHWKACECGEISEQAAHTYSGRDTTNSIRCTVCGYKSAYKCLEIPTVGKAVFLDNYSLRDSAIVGFGLINNDATKLLETYSLSFTAKFEGGTDYLYEIDLSNSNMIYSGVYNYKGKVYTEYYVVLEDYFVYCETENAIPTAEIVLTADFDDLLGKRTIALTGNISMPTLESRAAASEAVNEAEKLNTCINFLSRGFELPPERELHERIADYKNLVPEHSAFYLNVAVEYIEEIQTWLVDVYAINEQNFIEVSENVGLAEGLALGYTLNIGCEKERNIFKRYYNTVLCYYPDEITQCLDAFANMYVGCEGLYNEIIEGAVTEEEKLFALINNSPNSIVVDMLFEVLLSRTPLAIASANVDAEIRPRFFNFISNYLDEMDLESDATECYLMQMKYHIQEYFNDPQRDIVPPTKKA